MRPSLINEAEHRRGMVLGFTLAEVLLLLLFLLILAFGAQIVELQGEGHRLAGVPSHDGRSSDVRGLAERQRLERENRELREKVTSFSPLWDDAEKINPNDPPAALKRGLDWLRKFGLGTSPDQVQPEAVQPEFAALVDEARKIDPNAPARVLGLALEALKKATKTPPPAGKHDWPPIITLSEANGNFFESGSAELSPDFQANLSNIVIERLLAIVHQYEGVNVVEVVGHTDEQPLASRPSNLDKVLQPFLQGQPTDSFIPSDNAGLGLARAVSVARVLLEDKRLNGLRVLPLSGAQLIDTGDMLSIGGAPEAVKQRRRIEIRVRRSDKVGVPDEPDSPKITVVPELPPQQTAPDTPRPKQPARFEMGCSGVDNWLNPQCW